LSGGAGIDKGEADEIRGGDGQALCDDWGREIRREKSCYGGSRGDAVDGYVVERCDGAEGADEVYQLHHPRLVSLYSHRMYLVLESLLHIPQLSPPHTQANSVQAHTLSHSW
jgi:hypothetical protein